MFVVAHEVELTKILAWKDIKLSNLDEIMRAEEDIVRVAKVPVVASKHLKDAMIVAIRPTAFSNHCRSIFGVADNQPTGQQLKPRDKDTL